MFYQSEIYELQKQISGVRSFNYGCPYVNHSDNTLRISLHRHYSELVTYLQIIYIKTNGGKVVYKDFVITSRGARHDDSLNELIKLKDDVTKIVDKVFNEARNEDQKND